MVQCQSPVLHHRPRSADDAGDTEGGSRDEIIRLGRPTNPCHQRQRLSSGHLTRLDTRGQNRCHIRGARTLVVAYQSIREHVH